MLRRPWGIPEATRARAAWRCPDRDAQRDQPQLEIAPLHLVEQLGGHRRAGGRDRVAEGDRAAVGVDRLLVETEVVDDRQRLRGEGLVELDQLDRSRGLFEPRRGRQA